LARPAPQLIVDVTIDRAGQAQAIIRLDDVVGIICNSMANYALIDNAEIQSRNRIIA